MAELKRCQVCGQQFDSSRAEEWACVVAHGGQHVPTDRHGTIYVLHFDQPTEVADADRGHVHPTTHYVGWTSQPVSRRVRQHRVPQSSVVHTRPGTAEDERALKRTEACPRCGVLLAAECLGRS